MFLRHAYVLAEARSCLAVLADMRRALTIGLPTTGFSCTSTGSTGTTHPRVSRCVRLPGASYGDARRPPLSASSSSGSTRSAPSCCSPIRRMPRNLARPAAVGASAPSLGGGKLPSPSEPGHLALSARYAVPPNQRRRGGGPESGPPARSAVVLNQHHRRVVPLPHGVRPPPLPPRAGHCSGASSPSRGAR